MVETAKSLTGTLNSWKEIAQFLERGVRTVQRWEHELGLPVHRIGNGRRSPVFATTSELNFWFSTVEIDRPSKPSHLELIGNRIQRLRQSRLRMRNLTQTMAENTAQQRRQTELAKERMAKLRSRLNRAS